MKGFLRRNFIDVFNLARKGINTSLTIILLDLCFIASFSVLKVLSDYLSSVVPVSIPIFVLISLVYFLSILLVYSFLKYCVLWNIRTLFEKHSLSFGKFWNFYLLNLILGVIFAVIIYAIGFISSGLKIEYQPYFFILLSIPYIIYLHFTINISHSVYYEANDLGKSLSIGFSDIFLKFKKYYGILFSTILILVVSWIIFLGYGYLIKSLLSSNMTLYINHYIYYTKASLILSYVVLYLIIFFNRINFYSILRK